MAIKLKKVRANMRSAKADSATPLPVAKSTMDRLAKEIKLTGGLRGVRRIYLPRNGEVFFGAQAESSQGNDRYAVKIKFVGYDGEYYTEPTPKKLRVETTSGFEVWIDKPNINKHACLFSCTCPDFRFNWEYPAYQSKNMVAKGFQQSLPNLIRQARSFQSYDRETPPTGTRPSNAKNPNPIGKDFKNPNNVIGMCKHVYRLVQFLVVRDLIQGSF